MQFVTVLINEHDDDDGDDDDEDDHRNKISVFIMLSHKVGVRV